MASVSLTGSGISFADYQTPAGGMANELFDHYEEGTYTPSFLGASGTSGQGYNVQTGHYVKTGACCNVVFYVIITTKGTISGDLLCGGLPFSASSASRSVMTYGYTHEWTLTSGHHFSSYIELNGSNIYLQEASLTSDAVVKLATGAIEDGTQLMGQSTYFVSF